MCLGHTCRDTVRDYVAATPGAEAHYVDPAGVAELADLGQFDYVCVSDTLEQLPKSHGAHLLARLRDLHGGRFSLLLAGDPATHTAGPWSANDMLAFGMTLVGHYPSGSGAYRLYNYDIADYKTVPDWFNSRFWAHPERWDKDYW